ncbi:MAG: class IV adenylate cyclase [Acidobacteriota bacterium]
MPIEHEVKLAFADLGAARQAVERAGGQLRTSRRLLDDTLFDRSDGALRRTRMALRIRRDDDHGVLTWKGPVQPGPVKSREEIETEVADPDALQSIFEALGFRPAFRSQKFREEYELDAMMITVDETPMGVFVEIEGRPEEIPAVTARLGLTPADFVLESYATLWRRWCETHGARMGDMLFDVPAI